MTENMQTVVETTETPAQPGAEADSARTQGDDLESLLATYTEQTKPAVADPPAPKAAATTDTDAAARLQAIEGAVNQFAQAKYKSDMKATVDTIRGDLPKEVFDDGIVEAWLDSQARNDARLQKAWLERDNNPQQFERIKTELGKSFAKKFSKLPDANATEDRAIVAAAVRGASTKAPNDPPPNFSRASNAEFRKEVQDKYGFDPGV